MNGSANPILALSVKPRWMPDLGYPRFKKWYSTSSYLSPAVTTLTPHTVPSGQNILNLDMGQRAYADSATAPARGTSHYLDITTPCYMLAGTTGDSLVGLDFFNPPLAMNKDINNLSNLYTLADDTDASLVCRVLAIKHKFTFINYNKHPVRLYYSVLPTGWTFPTIEAASAPMADQSLSGWRSIVIPAVMDAGDRGVTRHLNMQMNLESLFPQQYEEPPQVRAGDAVTENSSSPWIALLNGARNYITTPPTQQSVTNDVTSSAVNIQPPGLKCQFAVQNLAGVNVGSTAYTAETDGDINTNGLIMMADMNYLVEYVQNRMTAKVHSGNKAYPDQDA